MTDELDKNLQKAEIILADALATFEVADESNYDDCKKYLDDAQKAADLARGAVQREKNERQAAYNAKVKEEREAAYEKMKDCESEIDRIESKITRLIDEAYDLSVERSEMIRTYNLANGQAAKLRATVRRVMVADRPEVHVNQITKGMHARAKKRKA